MSAIACERFELPGVALLRPVRRSDARGYLCETFNARSFGTAIPNAHFVQENETRSHRKGTIRGLHFQADPAPQGKLVRCIRGSVLDVAIDIRRGSPTYGRHAAALLSAEGMEQLWVPPGFAHGFCTLEDGCVVLYKLTDFYAPEVERALAFDDPALGIDWPVAPSAAILSDKDRQNPRLADLPNYVRFEG